MRKSLKIAVTGAGGFIGTSVLEFFSRLAHVSEIRALYHASPPASIYPKVRCFTGDLMNSTTARDLVHGTDAVFHFAHTGFPHDAVPNPTEYLQNNLALTGSLLDAMVFEKVTRLIFTSTGGGLYRYNPFRKVPHHEGSEIEFRSPYGLSKYSNENLILLYKQTAGICPAILRVSDPFGKWQVMERRQGLIGEVFSRALRNEEIKLFGGLEIVKDFIHMDDLLRVFDGFLLHPDSQGIFNVGSGIGVSLREVITNIERVTHKKLRLSFAPFITSDCPWTVLNTSKLQKAINWTCRHSFFDAIQLIWNDLGRGAESPVSERKLAA